MPDDKVKKNKIDCMPSIIRGCFLQGSLKGHRITRIAIFASYGSHVRWGSPVALRAAPVSLEYHLWAPPFGGPDPKDDCHKHWGKFTNILLMHSFLLHITVSTYTLVMIMSCDTVLVHVCTLHMCLIIKILIPFFNDWHGLILFDIMLIL